MYSFVLGDLPLRNHSHMDMRFFIIGTPIDERRFLQTNKTAACAVRMIPQGLPEDK